MKIENIYSKDTPAHLPYFRSTYINMFSLQNYGAAGLDKKHIIKALKVKNTPLRKFISEVLNTKQFENDFGDCFISFNQKKDFLYVSDLVKFSFTQKHNQAIKHTHNLFKTEKLQTVKSYKEIIANHLAEQTAFNAGFIGIADIILNKNEKSGTEKLADYIKGSKIVEDLKKHIEELRNKYIINK